MLDDPFDYLAERFARLRNRPARPHTPPPRARQTRVAAALGIRRTPRCRAPRRTNRRTATRARVSDSDGGDGNSPPITYIEQGGG